MKKVTIIVPIILMLIVTALMIFFIDKEQSKNYLRLDSYEKESIMVNYNETIIIDNNIIIKMLQIANKNNVIIQKTNFSSTESNIVNSYFSFDSIEEICNFMKKDLNLEKLKNNQENAESFISTYNHDSKNQIAIIKDILENDKYNYYVFEKLLNENGNLFGEYVVYYNKYQDFDNFSNELKQLLGQDLKTDSYYNNIQKYIPVIILGAIIILLIFYFIFEIYEIYYKSNYIACMKLLGYDDTKITNLKTKRKSKIYIVTVSIITLLCVLFVKNISLIQIITLLIMNLILLFLSLVISHLCVKIISKMYKLSDILKKKNVASKISSISMNLKVFISSLLIVTSSIFLIQSLPLFDELKEYKNSQKLLKYGVISSFNSDRKEIYEYEKHSDLYKNIIYNNNLNTFYTEFYKYNIEEKHQNDILDKEEKGTYFRYASVDKNYLIKENVVIYNNDNKIDINDVEGPFFLFPKSKTEKIYQFENYYLDYSYKDYTKHNIKTEFNFYTYDDKELNTYMVNSNIKQIKSPILRVIDESIKMSYLETPLGINTFGTSLNTGLKIEIKDNKNETYKELQKSIKKSGLDNLIGINDFLSFNDYFLEQTKTVYLSSLMFAIVYSIIILIYITVSVQTIYLYTKSERKRIIIQRLLGHDKDKIFSSIINKNFKNTVLTFLISFFLLLALRKFDVLIYLLSTVLFLVLDTITVFIIIKTYNFKSIHTQLKGGEYD